MTTPQTGASRLERWRRALMNPILWREARARLRGKRLFVIVTAFMFILASALYLASQVVLRDYSYRPEQVSRAGRDLFAVLACIECGLIMVIAPAFSCATVTSERERRTYELLCTTLLSPRSVIYGKLGASVYFILLLVFSSIPILSTCLFLGGLSPFQVFLCVLILLATVVFYGELGLFFSVITKRTSVAASLTYITAVALNLLPLGLVLLLHEFFRALPGPDDFYYCLASCSSPVTSLLIVLVPEVRNEFGRHLWGLGPVITWVGYLLMASFMGAVMWAVLRDDLARKGRAVPSSKPGPEA